MSANRLKLLESPKVFLTAMKNLMNDASDTPPPQSPALSKSLRFFMAVMLMMLWGNLTPLRAQNFSDDFTRSTNSTSVLPWLVQSGNWVITNGVFLGGTNANETYGIAYVTNSLTNFSVTADFSAAPTAYGYGLGARVNSTTGARYAAWIYPENSSGPANTLRLIKFQDWGTSFTALNSVSIGAIGTNIHSLTMVLDTNLINVYLDGALLISYSDNTSPHLSGGVSVDMYTYNSNFYAMKVDNVVAAQINYPPNATNDFFTIRGDISQTVVAPGVLYNDRDPEGTNLTALLVSPPANGTLNLSANGGFTYFRTNSTAVYDSFTYRASDGGTTSGVAKVTLSLTEAGAFFSDNFTRATNPASLLPWTAHTGAWAITNGVLEGGTNLHSSYGSVYRNGSWTNYAVEGAFLFPTNGYGGGIAGRVNPATGQRYIGWLYPELSDRGPNNIRIAKFQAWDAYGLFNFSNAQAMATISLTGAVVTNTWHTLKLGFSANVISVYYDGLWLTNVVDVDTYTNAYASGGVGVDFFSYTNEYIFRADNIVARPLVADDNYTTSEETQLTITGSGVLTNDTSSTGLPLSAQLIGSPVNGTLSFSTNGSFTYTPASNFVGVDSFIYECRQGTNSLGAAVVNITVESVNDAPQLPVQPDYYVAAGNTISITNTASDPDVPANVLTYQLVGAPSGMTITTNGIISWTPALAQSPSSNLITTIVTDNGIPALSDTNFITVVVTNPPGVYSLTSFYENFDGVTSPALPAGWTTTQSGGQQIWFTQTSVRDSLPNAVFAAEGATNGISELVSPAIVLGSGDFQLHFRNSYDLETHPSLSGLAFDGAVLEIKIGAGAFTDVIAAGGTFLDGAYTHTISSDFGNPLGGRAAWSGNSGGFISTILALPASVANQTIQFRWRCSTDTATSGNGWAVDNVGVSNTLCCNFFAPVLASKNNISIPELTLLSVTNTATDGDLPSDKLTYNLTSFPSGASITTNGVITWIPTEAQGPSVATFTTVVSDKAGLKATNSFTVTVTEVNVAPIATNDTYFLTNAVLTVAAPGILSNDSDADLPANALTAVLVSGPTNGVLSLSSNGGFTYTPNNGFSGLDVFTYRANDGLTNSQLATVSITVSNRAFVITSVTVNAGLATVTWNSTPGLSYRVQYLDTLTSTNWTDANPVVTATNISASVTNFVGSAPQRFYRVKVTDAPQPVILSLQVTNGNAVITWSSVVARDYRLQYKTNLTDVTWTEVTPSVTATAVTTTTTNVVGTATQRFFRVRMLP